VLVTNLRTRALALPAKLTPNIVALEGDKDKVYDLLAASMEEMLEEMSNYNKAFELPEDDTDGRGAAGTGGAKAGARADSPKGKGKKK